MRESLRRFQDALKERGLDAAVIASPEELSPTNLRYLSGFTGSSAYLLISQQKSWFVTDFRYLEQAAHECPDYEIVRHGREVGDTLAEICRDNHLYQLGFEADKVPFETWQAWNERVPVVWRPLQKLIEELRVIKSAEEVAKLRAAAQIAGESLMEILPAIVGRRERDAALDLEMAMRRRGAESLGFATIVASGERGALPHGHPTDRIIGPAELVTIDFGSQVDGYKSDETVTVATTGQIAPKLKEIFDLVAEAQRAGIEAAKPGNTSYDVDHAARHIITEAGYGEYFGHGTGHGVGLDVHEEPFAHTSRGRATELKPGMTITVEPGIYIPGLGGVRLEDTLVITETGNEALTMVPKHFRSIG